MSDDGDYLLHVVRRTCIAEVRSDHPDLTLRQLAVLLAVYRTAKVQTAGDLTRQLQVQKPAMSRALNRLTELGLVRRKMDLEDRRNVLVVRTVAGATMMERLGIVMVEAAQAPHDAS